MNDHTLFVLFALSSNIPVNDLIRLISAPNIPSTSIPFIAFPIESNIVMKNPLTPLARPESIASLAPVNIPPIASNKPDAASLSPIFSMNPTTFSSNFPSCGPNLDTKLTTPSHIGFVALTNLTTTAANLWANPNRKLTASPIPTMILSNPLAGSMFPASTSVIRTRDSDISYIDCPRPFGTIFPNTL